MIALMDQIESGCSRSSTLRHDRVTVRLIHLVILRLIQ